MDHLDHTIVELSEARVAPDPAPPARAQLLAGVPQAGDRMGRYIVLSELGAGAMGVVLAVYDPELDRKAALKLLKSANHLSTGRERLRREAQALARLNHVNVVTVYDVGMHESQVFVAMEFVRGQTLREWMSGDASARPAWPEVLRVFMAAGRGLAAAHGVGLVHRDFKPDNVMIGDDGRVRVMDFGLARFGDRSEVEDRDAEADANPDAEPDATPDAKPGTSPGAKPDTNPAEPEPDTNPDTDSLADPTRSWSRPRASTSASLKLTQTGTQIGTPAYMAPEQFVGTAAATTSDQFAFCASLYEALYGQRPFRATTFIELARAVTRGQIRPPPTSSPVPSWIAKVVTRGLAPQPEDRHASMEALLAALAHDPRQRYRRLGAGAAMVAALAGAVWLGGTLSPEGNTGPQPCAELEAELEGSWDPARRAELEAALHATGRSYAGQTWERVERGLDDYTAAWVRARVEACQATQAGTQSEALLDRKMSCLDERLARVDALVDELVDADVAAVEQATQAVSVLPSLDACADADTLTSARPEPPGDPELARAVAAFDARLRLIEAKSSLADYDPALALAEALAGEVAQLDYAPTRVQVGLAQSSLRATLGRYEDAHASLGETYALALDHAMWTEALRAATQLMSLTGRKLQLPPEARRWAALADALHRVVGTDDAREGFLLRHARHLQSQGDYARARAELEQALELSERRHGVGHIRGVDLFAALGALNIDEGDFAGARPLLERALEINREALGPGHPEIANMLANLGIVAFRTGDYAEARAKLEQARLIFERAMGPTSYEVSRTLDSLGSAALLEGDTPSARDYYERAQLIVEAKVGPEHPAMAALIGNLGEVARNEGEFAEACAKQERARELFEAAHGQEHPALVLVQTELGKARLGLGEHGQAVVELERARGLAERLGGDPLALADIRFTLARALTGARRELPRALELAALARESYASAGEAAADELAEADAWLNERR